MVYEAGLTATDKNITQSFPHWRDSLGLQHGALDLSQD